MMETNPDMADQEYDNNFHARASKRIEERITELLDEGVIPDGGIVVSSMTIVETMSESGNSRTFVLFTDNRLTMLFGLLAIGNLHISAGIGEGPPQA